MRKILSIIRTTATILIPFILRKNNTSNHSNIATTSYCNIIIVTIVVWIHIFHQFPDCCDCFSAAVGPTILDRHLQQQKQQYSQQKHHQQLQQQRTHRQSSKLNSMEDSNVMITNRKKRSMDRDLDDDESLLGSGVVVDPKRRMKLMPTIRTLRSNLSMPFDDTSILSFAQRKEMAIRNIRTYTNAMQERYQQMTPFTNETETSIIIHSLQNVIPISGWEIDDNHDDDDNTMDQMLQELQEQILPQYAHVSHKNWTMTGENAKQWHSYLFPSSKKSSLSPNQTDNASHLRPQLQRHVFERIYREGNWDGAVLHQQQQQSTINDINVDETTTNSRMKPWAVLVTVRGERCITLYLFSRGCV